MIKLLFYLFFQTLSLFIIAHAAQFLGYKHSGLIFIYTFIFVAASSLPVFIFLLFSKAAYSYNKIFFLLLVIFFAVNLTASISFYSFNVFPSEGRYEPLEVALWITRDVIISCVIFFVTGFASIIFLKMIERIFYKRLSGHPTR